MTTQSNKTESPAMEMTDKKIKQRLSLNTLMGACALLTSVATVCVIFYQAQLQRQQQYASVTPILDVHLNNGYIDSDSYIYEYVVVNHGLGPAILEDFKLEYNGQSHDDFRSITMAIRTDNHVQTSSPITYSGLWKNRIIPAGSEVKLVSLTDNDLAPLLDQSPIRLILKYRSIYNEQWQFDSEAGNEQKIIKLR